MSERMQTIKLRALLREFQGLKAELFPDGASFVEVQASEIRADKTSRLDAAYWVRKKEARYQQLLAFFWPCFRTDEWVNPWPGFKGTIS